MSLGLFFENVVHYGGINPTLCYHVKKNRDGITELAESMFDNGVASFWHGSGRSGKDALRGKRNFDEGLRRLAYFAGSGFDPKPGPRDVYIPISGSGRRELAESAKIAKKHGMKVVAITGNPEGALAKEAEVIITMPRSIVGQPHIKDYFECLVLNQSGKKKEKIPFQALGAVFEISAMEFVDGLSCAFAEYDEKENFPFHKIEEKLYNSSVYMGELGVSLERQSEKINLFIETILNSSGRVFTTGIKHNAEISEIAAIRIHHEIYEKGKRRAISIDSRHFPKIKKGDILIPVSGSGEAEFTNYVAKAFLDVGNPIFPITYGANSRLVENAGVDNSIIFPLGNRYRLSKGYTIKDFDVAAVKILDAVALSLGRIESEMKNTHSAFA